MHTDSINHFNNDNSVWCACRTNGAEANTDKQDKTRNTTHTRHFGDNFFSLLSQRTFDFVSHFSFFDGLFGDELGQNTFYEHEHVASLFVPHICLLDCIAVPKQKTHCINGEN